MSDLQSAAMFLLCAIAASWLGCGGGPAEPLASAPPAATADASTTSPSAPTNTSSEPGTVADATPTATASAAPSAPPAAPEVEVGKPSFVGDGTVPKVEAFLDKTRDEVAQCVAEHGGLSGDKGEMKVQFLVRLRSKAEGVDVMSSEGVSEDAERCVRDMLRGKSVATPTADPVGVQFRYRFTRSAP